MTTQKTANVWRVGVLAAGVLAAATPQSAAAQEDRAPGRVARLSFVQNAVSLQPGGETEWVEAAVNRPLTTGDRLWSDTGSRAELRLDGATLRLDGGTGLSFLDLDERAIQLQLSEGTLAVRVKRLAVGEALEIDTPNLAFSILAPGRYRVHVSGDGATTVVTVSQGAGEVANGAQSWALESGQRGTFSGTDTLAADIGNAPTADTFDAWAEERDERAERSVSARYVSPNVVGYEDLDDHGAWHVDVTYGPMWYPSGVDVGWAPYREGRWAWVAPWGWTWIDDMPWGFAPSHYGRWVHHGRWGWVPGPVSVAVVYSPAWVVFVSGDQFGAPHGGIGWFPLGPGEVYSARGGGRVTYVNRAVPGAIIAVSLTAFASAEPVRHSQLRVEPRLLASAPLVARATVVPSRNGVLGVSVQSARRVARPSEAVVSRRVIAVRQPPPPPVPFAQKERALAAHPGVPLDRAEESRLRPATTVAHPLVKVVPATARARTAEPPPEAKPATAGRTDRPPEARPTQPGRTDRPTEARPTQPGRTDRPPDAKPTPQPAPSRPPETKPTPQPAPSRPPEARPTPQPAPSRPPEARPTPQPAPSRPPAAKPAPPARTDRPPEAKPARQPAPTRPPEVKPTPQPTPTRPPEVKPTPQPAPTRPPEARPAAPARAEPPPPAQAPAKPAPRKLKKGKAARPGEAQK
jgi:hypothetical protein